MAMCSIFGPYLGLLPHVISFLSTFCSALLALIWKEIHACTLQGNLHISFSTSILSVRQATNDKLLDIPYVHVDRYENINYTTCRPDDNQKACDALVYDSLIRGLQVAGLWPRKEPEEIHVSYMHPHSIPRKSLPRPIPSLVTYTIIMRLTGTTTRAVSIISTSKYVQHFQASHIPSSTRTTDIWKCKRPQTPSVSQ